LDQRICSNVGTEESADAGAGITGAITTIGCNVRLRGISRYSIQESLISTSGSAEGECDGGGWVEETERDREEDDDRDDERDTARSATVVGSNVL